MPKLWGGRFSQGISGPAADLNASIHFDWRMVQQDITGSVAWAKAIGKAGILAPDETKKICAGLEAVRSEVNAGTFEIQPDDEDVHTAVERRLTEMIGPLAGKLHTGRSRNDQVMTDFNLWLKEELAVLDELIRGTEASLLQRARQDMGILVPGYTHMQRAQPVLLSHWWLAHFWPLQRDRERLHLLMQQTDIMPLGSGAISGASFPVKREELAAELGFSQVSPNSIDAVSNRDSAASFLFLTAMLGVHLSNLAEDLIIYSTSEFGFIELSDAFSTGSSLMPQKKNPDTLELTRGKAGTLIGQLVGLLTTLKGLPSAYDKDLQEDKPAVFAAADTVQLLLPVMSGVLDTLTVNAQKMSAAIDASMLATEMADYLVDAGVPFREAHHVIGQIVAYTQSNHQSIADLSGEKLHEFHPAFSNAFKELFSAQKAIERRQSTGGTASQAVLEQIEIAQSLLD
jgi:argininosuccinate lyase